MTDDMTRRHDEADSEPQRDVDFDQFGLGSGADVESEGPGYQLRYDEAQRNNPVSYRIGSDADEKWVVGDTASDSSLADPTVPSLARRIGERIVRRPVAWWNREWNNERVAR
ncbi:MAG: hypothetical protein P8I25_00050, partial [Ilumatobacter sp.]|nr:hypothetical protein [Ilumatobacter sp.]